MANAYAQTLGQVFTHEMKPYEVEILVAQVGAGPDDDELFHILYDGTVMDEEGCTVLGGQADTIAEVLDQRYRTDITRDDAIRLGAEVLAGADGTVLGAAQLEVAFLDRAKERARVRACARAPSSRRCSPPAARRPTGQLPLHQPHSDRRDAGRCEQRDRDPREPMRSMAAILAGVRPFGRRRQRGVDLADEQHE